MGPHPEEIPIFELPLAILPTERLPLHIFEERYKRMIAHCLDSSAPFGVVLRTDAGARAIGCAATVDEVLDTFEDGRMNILMVGTWRFRVDERFEGEHYPLALVKRLPEDPAGEADTEPAQAALDELLEAIGSEPSATPRAEPEGAFEIASRIELPNEIKQELLDAESEPERLEILTTSLRRLATEVKRTRQVAELASSNGHGRIEEGRSE